MEHTLTDLLLAPQRRQQLIVDCVQLIEAHVEQRGGLKGMALKTGMAMLKKAKPALLPRATALLLPEFVAALEPLHQEFRASGGADFRGFMLSRSDAATLALLQVADARIDESDSAAVKSTYFRLRGSAEIEVAAAIPRLAELIGRHLH